MKIFLDTANLESIRKFNDMGLLDGITTNPSLMSKEGGNPKDGMAEITKIIKGDVSLEVLSTEYSGMIEEGKRLREYGKNVVVKVPMTPDGLKASNEPETLPRPFPLHRKLGSKHHGRMHSESRRAREIPCL